MHYSFNMEEIPIIPVKHGNAKKEDAQVFRPTQHSVKIKCGEAIEKSQKAPRLLAESIGDADTSIIESKTVETGTKLQTSIELSKQLWTTGRTKSR